MERPESFIWQFRIYEVHLKLIFKVGTFCTYDTFIAEYLTIDMISCREQLSTIDGTFWDPRGALVTPLSVGDDLAWLENQPNSQTT